MKAARISRFPWPSAAIPPAERMAGWLKLALENTLAMAPERRNRIYKARVTARKALAMARGDIGHALAIAQLGEAEVAKLDRATTGNPAVAREAAVRIAKGEIGHGKLETIVRKGLTESALAEATVPPWPLEAKVPEEIPRNTRWDTVEAARRASGLSSRDFAALHGLPATYVRKCTMLTMAARRLADGKAHRARRILAMSHIRILEGDKAVRSGTPQGKAVTALLDRRAVVDG